MQQLGPSAAKINKCSKERKKREYGWERSGRDIEGTPDPAQLIPKLCEGTSKDHRTSPSPCSCVLPTPRLRACSWPSSLTQQTYTPGPVSHPSHVGRGCRGGHAASTNEGKPPYPSLSLHPGARGEAGRPAREWRTGVDEQCVSRGCGLRSLPLSSALFLLRRQK